jgi:hypothetical protein
MDRTFFAIAVIALTSLGAKPTDAAPAKCTSIQAQCAIEIGGRCDPVTGRWEYGRARDGGGRIGGTNRGGAFDACVSRRLKGS